jgi:hypothetical protein
LPTSAEACRRRYEHTDGDVRIGCIGKDELFVNLVSKYEQIPLLGHVGNHLELFERPDLS